MTTTRKPSSEASAATDGARLRRLALDLLARREHSALELRYKLARRGFPAAAIEEVVREFARDDLLNETRYAEVYACSRADKGYGPLRITRELRERGVSEDIVTTILRGLDDFWMPRLIKLHRKHFGAAIPADGLKQAQQTRFLRHRGFTLDQIKHLFRDS